MEGWRERQALFDRIPRLPASAVPVSLSLSLDYERTGDETHALDVPNAPVEHTVGLEHVVQRSLAWAVALGVVHVSGEGAVQVAHNVELRGAALEEHQPLVHPGVAQQELPAPRYEGPHDPPQLVRDALSVPHGEPLVVMMKGERERERGRRKDKVSGGPKREGIHRALCLE